MKVIVIGRGIAGLMTAFRLLKEKCEVIIVGPPQFEGAASFAAMGVVCHKGLIIAKNDLFAEQLKGGVRLLHKIIPELNHFYEANIATLIGVVEPFSDAQDFKKKKERFYHREFSGAFHYRCLNGFSFATSFCSIFNQIKDQYNWEGGFFFPRDGWFDPRALLNGLEKILRQNQLVSFVDDKVSFIQSVEEKIEVHTFTNRTFVGNEVVVSAGHGVEEIFRKSRVNFPSFRRFEGETVFTHTALPNGVLKFGKYSFVVNNGIAYAGGFDGQNVQFLNNRGDLSRLVSAEIYSRPFYTLKGVRIAVKDRNPVIGSIPFGQRRILCNFGFYKNGFTLAAFAADCIVNIIFKDEENKNNLCRPSRLF